MMHTAAMDELLIPPEGNSADDEYYFVTWEVERASSYPIRSVTEALRCVLAGGAL
jgi:hypothetical protein